jgi:hypothetical protein
MDDPVIRSRLGRVTGTRPLGPRNPSWGPLFFRVVRPQLYGIFLESHPGRVTSIRDAPAMFSTASPSRNARPWPA